MHAEGAQAVLANTNRDLGLVWDANLGLWGLVLGYHVEYIHPEDLRDMDEPALLATVSHKMERYVNSLDEQDDVFYKN
jgi:hypothetical protein